MRMRRKKNLETRVEQTDNLLFREPERFFTMDNKEDYKIDLKKVFGNSNPVYLEIGCGKGGLLKEMALNNPEINFIGVEKITNVMVSALENGKGINNLKFINCDAQNLSFILTENSIKKIMLNFSCPFPKKTYANRRLTNEKFLEIYKKIGCHDFTIEQKTDSLDFFEYSLLEYEKCGYKILEKSYDLYAEKDFSDKKIYRTEFEEYFISQKKPIRYAKLTL